MKLITGTTIGSNTTGPFEVLEDNNSMSVVIRFINTGTVKTVRRFTASKGEVKDPMHLSVYNVGCIGIGPHLSKIKNKPTKEYQKWSGMMKRCFNKKDPSYRGNFVCERWLNFQNFCDDLPKLTGYDLFAAGTLVHLDKDILVSGNRMYGPKFCQFVLPTENMTAIRRKETNNKEMPL